MGNIIWQRGNRGNMEPIYSHSKDSFAIVIHQRCHVQITFNISILTFSHLFRLLLLLISIYHVSNSILAKFTFNSLPIVLIEIIKLLSSMVVDDFLIYPKLSLFLSNAQYFEYLCVQCARYTN